MTANTLAIIFVGILQAAQAVILSLGISAINDLRARIARLEMLKMQGGDD